MTESLHPRFGTLATLAAVPAWLLTTKPVERLLLIVLLINVPLQLVKHFFVQQNFGELGSIGGLELSLGTLALLSLYGGWFVKATFNPKVSVRDSKDTRRRALIPVLMLFACYVLSSISASNKLLSMFEVWSLLQLVMMYFYFAYRATSREDVIFVVRVLLVGLVLEGAIMQLQQLGLLNEFNLPGVIKTAGYSDFYDSSGRLTGTAGSPNSIASYLGIVMTVALGVLCAPVQRADRWLAGLALVMAAMPLAYTSSRGGWLAFGISASVLLLGGIRHIPFKAIVLPGFAAFMMLVPFMTQVSDRVAATDDGAAAARAPLNEVALLMASDHPLLGIGANNFPVALDVYQSRCCVGQFAYSVHNKYLLTLSETGIGGLVCFLWFLGAVLFEGVRCLKQLAPQSAMIAWSCTAALLGLMAHMFFDVFREGPALHMLWIIAGIVAALSQGELSQKVKTGRSLLPVRRRCEESYV